MPKEVNDIDELEAMLAGLDEDELNQLDELDQPAPEKPQAKPAPRRRLKPLVDEAELGKKPVKAAPVVDADVEDADLAALSDLDIDEAAPVVAPANSPVKMDAARLEEFALEVIDLMTTLGDKYSLEEDKLNNLVAPVLAKITETSTLAEVEQQMVDLLEKNEAQVKLGDTPFTEDEAKPTDELRERVEAGEDRFMSADEVLAESIRKNPEPELGDAELDALLAAVPEVEPTPKPVPTAPSKPVAVTATRKAGALNTFIDADQLQRDLHFTESSINEGMTRQAALFAHYARLSADATYQSDRAKQQVELLEAQLNQKFRDAMITAGTKFTEKSIDAMVIQDSGYQAAQERAHEARAIASMVASAADSFRHRKDMLIQVGADLRLEKQGELRMKEHAGERALSQLEKTA